MWVALAGVISWACWVSLGTVTTRVIVGDVELNNPMICVARAVYIYRPKLVCPHGWDLLTGLSRFAAILGMQGTNYARNLGTLAAR